MSLSGAVTLFALAVAAAIFPVLAVCRGAVSWWTGLAGRRTATELANMFMFVSARRLVQVTLVVAAASGLLGALLGLPVPAVLALVVALLTGPRLLSRLLRLRWRARVSRQLPDALGLWAGLLRAGHSGQQALWHVAQRQGAPLGSELRLVLSELRMGVTMESAFASLRDRAGLADLRMLSTLLSTQRELGGNLAESLLRLAELLRQRLAMESRIGSLTAQGRMQGVVVGALPILLLVVLYFMEPDAMHVLHTTWQGWVALTAIAVLELVGFGLIRRIVSIDI